MSSVRKLKKKEKEAPLLVDSRNGNECFHRVERKL
jgi:hypothetical protein